MATVKVSALTAKTTPAGTEELLINDGGTSKKITLANAVKATDLPTAPSGIASDTNKEYNLKLTDSGGTETLTWIEETDDDTTYTSSDFTHDSLSGVTANEHIDWTGSSAGTIHSSNYTDTDTVYTHPSGDGNSHVPATGTSNNGKILTAGSTANSISWEDAPVSLPTQTSHSGKYLTTDGSDASWSAVSSNSTSYGLYEHAHTISADYTITSGNNALTAGPITIDSGYSVTIPTGSTWVVA